jgi:hypothetical protein
MQFEITVCMQSTPSYQVKRIRRLEKSAAYRAAIAAQLAITALAPHLRQQPLLAQRAHEACAQMRRSLAAGFTSPPGSTVRYTEYKAAWHAARTLDQLVHNKLPTIAEGRNARRAIDRADVLISGLPGVTPL